MKDSHASQYALLLSTVEIGLGSALHSFHIPLSGQLLSLHQIFLMTLATKSSSDRWSSCKISAYAGLMKLGMGQGKKIIPMIAITVQGLLFNLGFVCGCSVYVGAVLSSLWALVQPFLVFQFLSLGSAAEIIEFYVSKANAFGIPVVSVCMFFVCLKIVLAIVLCFFASKFGAHAEIFYESLLRKFPVSQQASKSMRQEIFRPLFVISIAVLAFYYWQTQSDNFYFLTGRAIGLALLGIAFSRLAFKIVWCVLGSSRSVVRN